jgi:hypothetical protein
MAKKTTGDLKREGAGSAEADRDFELAYPALA